jgi:hypothetical protein
MYRPGVVPRTPVPAAGAHHSCPKPLWQELARHARRCAAAKNPRSWAALVAAVPWVHPRSFADAIRLSQSMALTTTTATTADFDGAELFQAAAGSLLLHSRDARDLFNLLFVGNGTFPLLFAQPRPAQPLVNTNPRRLVMLDGSYPGDGRPPGSAATADKDLLIDLLQHRGHGQTLLGTVYSCRGHRAFRAWHHCLVGIHRSSCHGGVHEEPPRAQRIWTWRIVDQRGH